MEISSKARLMRIAVNGTDLHYDIHGEGEPLLWLHGNEEEGAAAFPELGQALETDGFRLRRVDLPEGHAILSVENRVRALEEVHRFIDEHSGRSCD